MHIQMRRLSHVTVYPRFDVQNNNMGFDSNLWGLNLEETTSIFEGILLSI